MQHTNNRIIGSGQHYSTIRNPPHVMCTTYMANPGCCHCGEYEDILYWYIILLSSHVTVHGLPYFCSCRYYDVTTPTSESMTSRKNGPTAVHHWSYPYPWHPPHHDLSPPSLVWGVKIRRQLTTDPLLSTLFKDIYIYQLDTQRTWLE
jgi:hypothetical protein